MIDKGNPGWACKFFAIFSQLFRKIHVFGPVQNWLQDTVRITRNDMLPITGFDYGLLRGKANITVGNLVCKGLCNNRNIQKNIRHSRYNDPSPSRYNERHSIYDYDTVCDLT